MAIRTLLPLGDTYADEANPTTNFGSGTSMVAQSRDVSRNRRAYVRFLVTGPNSWENLPAGATVVSATLRLYVDSRIDHATAHTIQIHRIGSTWDESTLTWNNPPATISGTLFGSAAEAAAGTWQEFSLDLTEFDLMRTTPRGVRIKYATEGSTQDNHVYRTKEHADTSTWPQLVIVDDTVGGNNAIWFFFQRQQKFLQDLKRGLVPPDLLRKRYQEVYAI